jgi:hypothetical protein
MVMWRTHGYKRLRICYYIILLCLVVSCHVMLCHMSYYLLYHIISYRIMLYISYHITYIVYRIIYRIIYISYNTIYHISYIILYYIILYYIILYYITNLMCALHVSATLVAILGQVHCKDILQKIIEALHKCKIHSFKVNECYIFSV